MLHSRLHIMVMATDTVIPTRMIMATTMAIRSRLTMTATTAATLPLTAWVMWHARIGVTGGIIDPTPMVELIDLTHMAGLTVLPPMEWVTAREWAMWDIAMLDSARRMEWPEAASYTTVGSGKF